jgi:hypothetical protein
MHGQQNRSYKTWDIKMFHKRVSSSCPQELNINNDYLSQDFL